VEAPPPAPEPSPPPKPPRLPPGPKVEGTPPSALPKPPVVATETPPPPKKAEPVKRGRRPSRGTKPATAPAAEVAAPVPVGPTLPPEPAPPPAPAPRLGQILTAEQTKEYRRNLESSAERARQALVSIQGKPLTSEQNEMVGRIRSFLQQADQVRDQDLVTAASLAERAHSLARDLLAQMR
jgi:hypothetical protein